MASAGPFSAFPGIQRSLTLRAGNGLRLQRTGGDTTLNTCAVPLAFGGDEAISATPLAGEVLDLNLMSRREKWRQRLEHLHLHGDLQVAEPATVRLLLCNSGELLACLDEGREFALHARQALLMHEEPGGLALRARDACLYLGLLQRRG